MDFPSAAPPLLLADAGIFSGAGRSAALYVQLEEDEEEEDDDEV